MDDDGQRYLALIVLLLAGVGIWLHSQGKFVGVVDALFKGKAATAAAPTQYIVGQTVIPSMGSLPGTTSGAVGTIDPQTGLPILAQPAGIP